MENLMKKKSRWDAFFETELRALLIPGSIILDIGAGLRVDPQRGNVVDLSRSWIRPLLEKVTYHVMDPVDTYHPDIIGDIMNMPLKSSSYDVVICLAVLEHVPKPWLAMEEMVRVLKPGGSLFLYVPFLYPYHAMPGYYGDYVRFTEDGIRSLCEGLDIHMCPVRGRMETLVNLCPSFIKRLFVPIARSVDGFYSGSGKQVSGFYLVGKRIR